MGNNGNGIEGLGEIAAALPDAILERGAELERMGDRLDWLESRSCNGTEYWRNKNHPTREPKLYINHGIDQACPMHGKPEAGKRLRIYVGADLERIKDAREWLENEEEREALQERYDRLKRVMDGLKWEMRDLFRAIGYTYPNGNDDLPEPDPNWRPERAARWW